MALARSCNGCSKPVAEDGFHEVQVKRASLPGPKRGFGLAADQTVVGDLCDLCWSIVKLFVGDNSPEESEHARLVIAEPFAFVDQPLV